MKPRVAFFLLRNQSTSENQLYGKERRREGKRKNDGEGKLDLFHEEPEEERQLKTPQHLFVQNNRHNEKECIHSI